MMKIAVYIGKKGAETEIRLTELIALLEKGGCKCFFVDDSGPLAPDTDMVLSVGGDGTFLSVSKLVADSGIPVVGVNMGRLGFLSENRPEDVAEALLKGEYTIEDRALLCAFPIGEDGAYEDEVYALNEITVHRNGPAVLGVDVCLDGKWLPTYWADGLIVSTSSGSTAYSLSVGGPIVLPQSKVLIVSPIAPHNLNIRPLVVPDNSEILLSMQSRDGKFVFTADNVTRESPEKYQIKVAVARFSLRRVQLNKSDFINALTEKLFWGEDVRNIK